LEGFIFYWIPYRVLLVLIMGYRESVGKGLGQYYKFLSYVEKMIFDPSTKRDEIMEIACKEGFLRDDK